MLRKGSSSLLVLRDQPPTLPGHLLLLLTLHGQAKKMVLVKDVTCCAVQIRLDRPEIKDKIHVTFSSNTRRLFGCDCPPHRPAPLCCDQTWAGAPSGATAVDPQFRFATCHNHQTRRPVHHQERRRTPSARGRTDPGLLWLAAAVETRPYEALQPPAKQRP